MRKVLLFGGSFDPPHNGHITMARMAMAAVGADELMLIPSAAPPHKIKNGMAPGEDRLAMCRLALPEATVSDIEISRGGVSFTADTLAELTAKHPDTAWYFLCGADMFLTVSSWWHYEDILRLTTLVTMPRNGVSVAELQTHAATLASLGGKCVVLADLPPTVSSTEIRERLARGEDIAGLVPPSVADYIADHRLYTEVKRELPTDEQIIEIIRKRESSHRFRHSLAVADAAKALAGKYGGDAAKLYTCGLLHDIFKDAGRDAQLQIFKEFGILLDEVTAAAPKLWHAVAGAAFIEHILGFTDRETVDAVRYHTTGRAGMCLTEKLLFLADFISADRDYEDVDVMREKAMESIDAGLEYALGYTVCDLVAHGHAVHPDTLAAYNDVILHKSKGGHFDG